MVTSRESAQIEGEITVVTGLPRSGTSLLMQMLEAGGMPVLTDGVRPADADNPRGYYELERVKRLARDAAWLGEARGHAVKIVAPLLTHLPREYAYRVVLIERDIEEVMASQARMLARAGVEEADPGAGLAAAFERQLERARSLLAERGIPILAVRHADAIADPVAVADALSRYGPRELDRVAMAAVVDDSLYRQRRRATREAAPRCGRPPGGGSP